MYYLETGIFVILLIQTNAFGSKLWKEPDAWGRVKVIESDVIDGSVAQEVCKCPIVEECNASDNNQLSIIYYKKILNLLFNIDHFTEDEIGIYSGTLKITLNSDQIKVLKNSKDPRDWDVIVSNVFKVAERIKYPNLLPSYDNVIITFLKWLQTNFINLISVPQLSFLLATVGFIVTIIYINRKYNYGFIAIFLVFCFLSGFAYTYYDCNKQLEIGKLVALLDSEGNDPCQNIKPEKKAWSIWNIFNTQSTKEQCIEYLKEKHKTELPFCRPDEVFLIYVNEIILNQFQRIVEKSTNIFKNTLEHVPFPYNVVAVSIFGLMLPLFLKMIFQHIFDPRVWFAKSSNNIPKPSPIIIENSDNKLLNKLILEKLEYHQKKTDAKLLNLERSISGVQIVDAIESSQKNIISELTIDYDILNTAEILGTTDYDMLNAEIPKTSNSIQSELLKLDEVDDQRKLKES